MRKIAFALLLHLVFVAMPTLAPGYDWPLFPWNNVPVHKVTGTLGEFRPRSRFSPRNHFHEGIDLPDSPFTFVFASTSGRVERRGRTFVQVGDKVYKHVIRYGAYLRGYLSGQGVVPERFHIADLQLLIDPQTHDTISHLHFEELGANNVPVNPFADGHLVTAPGFDSEWPQVVDIWFQVNDTDTCLPEQNDTTIVRGRIDIVARAKDEMPDPGSKNVGLYRMAYLVRDRYGNLVSDTVESCRFDTVPNHDHIFNCYQETITFSDGSTDATTMSKYYYIATWRNASQYDYWNTKQKHGAAENVDADSIGEAEYPDKMYRVAVLAWDRADHGGLEDSARGADTAWVIVDNFLPVVASTDPDSSESGVPPDIDIKATFSEPMAESTITSCRVIVVEMSEPPDTVAGVVSYDDSTYILTFNPDSSLEEGAEYEVTISDSLTDLAENRLDGDENGVAGGDYSWRFTVGGQPLIYVTDDDDCIFTVLRLNGSVHKTWTLDPDDYYIRDICVDRSRNCYALGDDWNAGKNVVLKLNSEGQLVDTFQLEYNAQWRCITTDNTHYYVGGDGKVLKYECATGEFKGSWEVEVYTPDEVTYSYYSDLLYVYNCEGWAGWTRVEAWPTTGGDQPVYASEKDHWWAKGLAVDDIGVYSCGSIWLSSPYSSGIRVWSLDLSEVVYYWEQESGWDSDQLEILGDSILCIEFPSVMPPWPKLKLRDKFDGDYIRDVYGFDYDDCLPFSMAVYDPSLPVGGENLAGPEGGESILCHDGPESLLRPERFSLLQNSPNPVAQYATIGYTVPHEASVELKIYDVGGGLVRTLVGRTVGPGYYSVDWDGRDILGRPVSGGVYFYRLTAGDFTATRKMVVLK